MEFLKPAHFIKDFRFKPAAPASDNRQFSRAVTHNHFPHSPPSASGHPALATRGNRESCGDEPTWSYAADPRNERSKTRGVFPTGHMEDGGAAGQFAKCIGMDRSTGSGRRKGDALRSPTASSARARLNPAHHIALDDLLRFLARDRRALEELRVVVKDRAGEDEMHSGGGYDGDGQKRLYRKSQVDIFSLMLEAFAELVCVFLKVPATRLVRVDPRSYGVVGSRQPPKILERHFCYVTSLHRAVGGGFSDFVLGKLKMLVLENTNANDEHTQSAMSASDMTPTTMNELAHGPVSPAARWEKKGSSGGEGTGREARKLTPSLSARNFAARQFATRTLAGLVRVLAIEEPRGGGIVRGMSAGNAFAERGSAFFAVYVLGRWMLELIGRGHEFQKLKELEIERRRLERERAGARAGMGRGAWEERTSGGGCCDGHPTCGARKTGHATSATDAQHGKHEPSVCAERANNSVVGGGERAPFSSRRGRGFAANLYSEKPPWYVVPERTEMWSVALSVSKM